MATSTIISIILFTVSLLFSLLNFIVVNVFLKRFEDISIDLKSVTKELKEFVLKVDHQRDLDEIKRRLERLEETSK